MVSVIIPNYNKFKYLEETINCLKSQSLNLWECIIIDDNSTDGSLELIKNLTDDDFRFKIIVNKINKGACFCRNQGIKAASSEYIIFLDADDYLHNDCLHKRIIKFHDNPSADFLVFPTGTFKKKIGDCEIIWNKFDGNHLNRFLAHDLPWLICSVIWKKSFLKIIGGFDESYPRLQDVALHSNALKFHNVNYSVFSEVNPDSFYRIDSKRISDKFEFLMKDINGKTLFIQKMNSEFPNNKFLKGTYFESLVNILVFYRRNEISKKQFFKLVKKVLNTNYPSNFGFLDLVLIKTYIILGSLKLYFKGMNKLFKTLLIK